jgi:hypothetical protein
MLGRPASTTTRIVLSQLDAYCKADKAMQKLEEAYRLLRDAERDLLEANRVAEGIEDR